MIEVSKKIGEEWPEGCNYIDALKLAYMRAGDNINFFL